MTIPFSIDGAYAVVPGVYDTFRVANSLPAPVPAGRSVVLLAESDQGIPGSGLDLRLNFFTDYNTVKAYYGNGAICDAAKALFTNQPSPAFAGSVQRLYIWKTNQTTRATKAIAGPSGYGSLAAAVYSEAGNFIKSQILNSTPVLPTTSFSYLPTPRAATYDVTVNGVRAAAISLLADATPAAMAAALNSVSGLSATGGTSKADITGSVDLSLSASGDVLTMTKTGGGGSFSAVGLPGDIAVISFTSGLAGAGSANSGVYRVESWSTTQVALRQLKHTNATTEVAAAAFDLTAQSGASDPDLSLYSPIVVTQTAAPVTGQAATLEIAAANGDLSATGDLLQYDNLSTLLSVASAAIGTITATVPGVGQLALQLATANWTTTPKAGDAVRIERTSPVAGASKENVGLYTVVSATGNSLLLDSCYGLAPVAVATTILGGNQAPVQWAPASVSTSLAGKTLLGASEGQAWVLATRTTDGASFPATKVGGVTAMTVSYNSGTDTSATLTIDQNRVLTITPSTSPAVTVRTAKYKTLQMLVDYLNTQANVTATIPDNRNKQLPTQVLDEVQTMPCFGSTLTPAGNGRIKKDYYDWTQLFAQNTGFLSFAPGSMTYLAGLPAGEATASFLSGAALGATSDGDIQAGLDKALKIDVRMVLPAFSRDAVLDIADGLTDASSSYSIDAIIANVKSHVATASSTLNKRERFGMLSYDNTFAATLQKVASIGYERCQMTFQQVASTDSNGASTYFLPWMAAAVMTAGRCQAPLGTSLLNKSFGLTGVRHTGLQTLYPTDSQLATEDFDPEDTTGQMTQAIEAGLLVLQAVSGSGIVLGSPDLSTRSKDNDPQAWVYERVNVLFTCDEVRQTLRSTLHNFIGNRQSDTPLAVVKTAGNDVIGTFIGNRSLLSGQVTDIKKVGTGYRAAVKITPVEALEFIVLDVVAERSTT